MKLFVLLVLFPFLLKAQKPPLKGAKWIGINFQEVVGKRSVSVFKKEFFLDEVMAIKKAQLYITALGIYEASLNGERISRNYFAPGFTVYDIRLQYQEYDVSQLLKKGKNVLEVLVGEGWYRGTFRNLQGDSGRDNFGRDAGLLLRLNGTRNNGKPFEIVSDETWKCAESGIRYSEIYDGEFQDSRFVPKDWKDVRLLDQDKQILIESSAPPVRKQETFNAVRNFITPKGENVIDFGQNIAGWVELKVKGKFGDTLRLSHAEILDADGNFYTGNLRNAKAMDTYILNGELQVLEPHFTYHGFRYVKVEGMKIADGNFKAVALYSDLRKTGTFECSDPMLNQLHSNIEWSMKSNFVDIPTDCPQRSERLGWTGDAQVFAGTASFLRDTKTFYRKWLEDVAAEQGKNGAVPNFVPTSSPYKQEVYGVAGWGDVATILPWTLFESYGDTALLKMHYPMMKGWVDYMTSATVNGLFSNKGYGDWYAMGETSSVPYIGQCFYARSTALLLKTAKLIGMQDDVSKYELLLAQIKSNFLRTYGKFDSKETSTQTAYVLALHFDILPEGRRQEIADKLAERVIGNGNKLATGFLGTPYLLPVLSRFGHQDLAYKLLFQKECPSWLYPITKGATTIWERWDAIRPNGEVQPTSFNHYAYGAVGQWMYENIVGIQPASPGYSKVVIKPIVGGGLTWAKGSYISKYGKISVSWRVKPVGRRSRNKFGMTVVVPKGTTAEVWVPGSNIARTVTKGKHHFKGIIKT